MKLSLITAALLMSASTAMASDVQLGVSNGKIHAQVYFERGNPLTERVLDVMLNAPGVTEKTNMYVPPGTEYVGDGFRMSINTAGNGQKSVALNFELDAQKDSAVISQKFMRLSTKKSNGTVTAFYRAMLNSKSSHALTHGKPGTSKINPVPMQVVVLEGDSYGGMSVSCSQHHSVDSSQPRSCEFHLR